MNANPQNFGQQLLATWKELGLNQRVSIVLAGLALIIGLVGVGLWSSRPDYSLLYGKLDDAESNKVVSALNDAKVDHQIRNGSIYVPSDKVHLMRWQLAAKGIGKSSTAVGYELFDKPAFGISDLVQRANLLRAIQGELGRTIEQVDSIESAQVLIVMPENRLIADRPKRPTASVFVRTSNPQLPPTTVNAIRSLVANAVEGLSPNFVAVIDNFGNMLSESNEDNSMAGLTTTQLGARKQLEDHFTKKVQGMLETVLGPGQAVVRVSAEINFDSITRTEEKFDPEGQVLKTATTNDENTDSLVTTPSGSGSAPGINLNTGETNSVSALNSTNQTTTKKKVTNNQYEINKTTSSLTQAAGGLKRLTAAVFIAARYTGSGTNRVANPRTPEELQKLRKTVQTALGIVEGDATRNDEITLEEISFNDQPALELAQRLEKDGQKQFWIELFAKLAYPALGLGVLGFFWRAVKKTPMESIPLGVPIGQLGANGHSKSNGKANGNGHSDDEELAPGVVTVDVLNRLIRENPSNMAQAVRTWMDRGNPK